MSGEAYIVQYNANQYCKPQLLRWVKILEAGGHGEPLSPFGVGLAAAMAAQQMDRGIATDFVKANLGGAAGGGAKAKGPPSMLEPIAKQLYPLLLTLAECVCVCVCVCDSAGQALAFTFALPPLSSFALACQEVGYAA